MKKIILILFVVFIFSACQNKVETSQKLDKEKIGQSISQKKDIPEKIKTPKEIDQKILQDDKYKIYEKWAYRDYLNDYIVSTEKKDCVDTLYYTSSSKKKDLISTLIVNKEARKEVNLEVYTPDYLAHLEKQIVNYTNSYFYADKVCHLADNLDILAGIIVPNDLAKEDEICYKKGTCYKIELAIFIIQDDEVKKVNLSKNIRTFDRTATGGEVESCDAQLENEKIIWNCFSSLLVGDDGIIVPTCTKWIIDLNGNILNEYEGEICM
jgi:hypothetical protein